MRISVGYQELSDLVKNRSGQKIDLAYVSQNTVKVSKEIRLPLIGMKSVGVNLAVIGFDGKNLRLRTVSNLLSKLLGLIKWPADKEQYLTLSEDQVIIHLGAFHQLDKVFEYAELQGVEFTPEMVELTVCMK
ncbi:MAG TPA: hypothetical protein H9972_06730 [Candidatus Paraprevotella stercorigallinarum]|jgi:hypothetical protein|nr:hypothetical protein [Candidatus Paraprevotella stercorigallinarum]